MGDQHALLGVGKQPHRGQATCNSSSSSPLQAGEGSWLAPFSRQAPFSRRYLQEQIREVLKLRKLWQEQAGTRRARPVAVQGASVLPLAAAQGQGHHPQRAVRRWDKWRASLHQNMHACYGRRQDSTLSQRAALQPRHFAVRAA